MFAGYFLGIDIGSTRVAAAVARKDADGNVNTTPVPLGRHRDDAAAAVFISPSGDLVFGDSAERRGLAEPERLISEIIRDLGDDVPIVAANQAFTAQELLTRWTEWVVTTVTHREQGAPARIGVTYPAHWGPHRIGLLTSALIAADLGPIDLIPAPEAAAVAHHANQPFAVGALIAVCDLGGSTFTASLLRIGAGGFSTVGQPRMIDDLGGANFDDAVFRHVLAAAAGSTTPDPEAEVGRIALLDLRRDGAEGKEALSVDSEAAIPVLLPTGRTTIRLTRSEFEDMIDPALDRVVDEVDELLRAQATSSGELSAIVLVGGSARIPRVTQRLSEAFDRPITIDPEPGMTIAAGAALAAARAESELAPVAAAVAPHGRAAAVAVAESATLAPAVAASLALASADSSGHHPNRWYSALSFGALGVAAALIIGGSVSTDFLGLRGGSDGESSAEVGSAPVPAPGPTGGGLLPTPVIEEVADELEDEEAEVTTANAASATTSAASRRIQSPLGRTTQVTPNAPRETPAGSAATIAAAAPAAAPAPAPTPAPLQTFNPAADDEPDPLEPTAPPTPTPAADPDPTTSDPDPTTSDPDPTTSDPDPTAADPDPTTSDPDPTTSDPEPTTPDPEPTTADPEPTTPDPEPSTEAPPAENPTSDPPIPAEPEPEPEPDPSTQEPTQEPTMEPV